MYKIKMRKRNGEMEKMRKSQQTFETVERKKERESYTLKDRANKVSFIYDEKNMLKNKSYMQIKSVYGFFAFISFYVNGYYYNLCKILR